MKRWPTKPLGEVAEFINGRAFKPSDWSSEGVPIIRIQNLTDPSASANQHIFKAEPKLKIEIAFLQHALSLVVERAKSRFQGSEMKHLTRGTLDEAEIPSPPLSLQKEFASRVQQIRELEAGQATSRRGLNDLFQSMLHIAFNGGL